MTDQPVFFLGGHDLEMAVIRGLLEAHAPDRFYDAGLAWGAKASVYANEIAAVLDRGGTAVLVELDDDLVLDEPRRRACLHVADHHGPLAGAQRPTSLEQVFSWLELPPAMWTRWYDLVAANDRGHVRAMQTMGATRDEIQAVRQADRAAQGIKPEQERSGRRAAADGVAYFDARLLVVHLPHGRTATVTDSLEPALGGPGYQNLLVVCPQGVTFFGEGRCIKRLDQAFPGGYYGGELPERGFWGFPQAIELHKLLHVLGEFWRLK